MTEESKNPLEIRCSACGAPAEFDIIHQIYQCRYCGQKVDANEPVERLKKWRALKTAGIFIHRFISVKTAEPRY